MRAYLDNNSTTFLDPRVLEVLIAELKKNEGNPSSLHAWGKESKKRLTQARETIAEFLQVKPNEILFTSGGTEGINFLIRGLKTKGPHII